MPLDPIDSTSLTASRMREAVGDFRLYCSQTYLPPTPTPASSPAPAPGLIIDHRAVVVAVSRDRRVELLAQADPGQAVAIGQAAAAPVESYYALMDAVEGLVRETLARGYGAWVLCDAPFRRQGLCFRFRAFTRPQARKEGGGTA